MNILLLSDDKRCMIYSSETANHMFYEKQSQYNVNQYLKYGKRQTQWQLTKCMFPIYTFINIYEKIF